MAAGHPSTPAHSGLLNRLYRPVGKKPGPTVDTTAPTVTFSPVDDATGVSKS